MATRSDLSYTQRSLQHPNPLARRLFRIAEKKETNIVLSADLTTTEELLKIADGKFVPMATPRLHTSFCSFRIVNLLASLTG
jgi:orotidine-5'-phosphate decarboxylase